MLMKIFRKIEESFPVLEDRLGKNELREFMSCKYEELDLYHFGLGTWIRNNLLKENSSLYKLFIKSGLPNKDEMSCLIIEMFYIAMNIKHKHK